MNQFHKTFVDDDNHALTARTYTDITARDADIPIEANAPPFFTTENIDKIVRVNSPVSYYVLSSIGPVVWAEAGNTLINSLINLTDTPSSYVGEGGNVLQVNSGETATEFGQKLGILDSPIFDQVILGDNGLVIGVSAPFSDNAGVLTLQNIDALDSITEATIESAIDTLANLTSIQGQTISLANSLTIESDNPVILNQDLTKDANVNFNNLTLAGNLTVQGTTTTIDSTTLLVEDKNIELGVVTTPTDITADGGGITLKGTTDKTIKWINSTSTWSFNQNVDLLGNNLITSDGNVLVGNGLISVGNILAVGNLISTTSGDLDITVDTGGVFKFESNALRAGQSATDYIELGHNSFDSFINAVGAGGLVLAFNGAARVEFNNLGHLSLETGTDQKDVLTLKTFNNINETGVAWKNSLSAFTHTIYRKDVGSNRADLHFAGGLDGNIDLLVDSFKIHGSLANEGRLEILGEFQISNGAGLNKVLTSDANGLGSWVLPAGGGWTDSGANIILTNINDKVGIGEPGPDTKLHVADGGTAGAVTPFAGTIATFESPSNGYISILTPDANKRGILFGEPSSNIAGGIIFNNGGNGELDFQFGGATLASFTNKGHLHLLTTVDQKHNLKIKTANNSNDSGIAWENSGGNFSQTIFRSDVGSNRSDLIFAIGSNADIDQLTNSFKIHGEASDEGKLEVLGELQISSGNPGLNKILTSSGSTGVTTWEAPTGNIIVQETFTSTNVRFFGELQLPSTQGWTDNELINGTITVFSDSVFGTTQDVIKYDVPASGDTVESIIAVSAADWINILTFGASYSGICRITKDVGTQSIFSGIGFSADNDPRTASSVQSRVGVFISVDATHTTIRLEGQPVVILDGASGSPLVLKDEWFKWEIFIDPTPDSGTSFGAVTLYVNGFLLVVSSIASSNNAINDTVSIQNSSSSGSTTFYFANFGVTIFEDSATKTLSATTMTSDVAQINIPEGRRDYTIILPDGNPRTLGSSLRLVASNVFGSINLKNQNPAIPEILYNGLRELKIDVFVKEIIEGINTVNLSNVYIGFKAEDISRGKATFAQLNSSVDQIPTDTNPVVITYNTENAINNIGHSISVNSGELQILPGFGGTYFIAPQPQVGKDQGATGVDFDMFLQVDRGSGFVDEDDSNIKLTIKDQDITDVIVSAFTIQLNDGDKIRMMQKVSDSGVLMGLENTDPIVGPPSVPRTPSIIFTMFRIGGI